jgi:RNA polymerase sigma factor (sigma-70 family)
MHNCDKFAFTAMTTLAALSCVPNSHQSLQSLYTEHHTWLFELLRRKLGNREQAADLAHDTFERILRAGVPQADEPRAYLRVVARRLAADHYRRSALEQAYLEALACEPDVDAPAPEVRLMVLESLAAVSRIIDGMGPRTRQIFLLSRLDGLTYPEIAAALRISPKTVQNAMSRAMQQCYAAVYG